MSNDRGITFSIRLDDDRNNATRLRQLATNVDQTVQSIRTKIGTLSDTISTAIPTQINADIPRQSGGPVPGGTAGPGRGFVPQNRVFIPSQTSQPIPTQTNTPPPAQTTRTVPDPASAKDAAADLTDEIESQIEALNGVREASERAKSAVSSNFRELVGQAEGAAGGVAQLASGLALLSGPDASASTKEIVEFLTQVTGFANVGLGAVKVVSSLAQASSLLADRSQLTVQSQQAQAAATKKQQDVALRFTRLLKDQNITLLQATNGNKKVAASITQHAEAAKRAAAANDRLSASEKRLHAVQSAGQRLGLIPQSAGRGGRGRGFIGGAASILGFEAISSFTGGSSVATGLGSLALDSALAGGGGAAAGGAGISGAISSIAGFVGPVGAAAGALGGLALVGKEVQEIWSGTSNQVGSLTDTIAGAEVSVVSWIGTTTGAFDLVGNAATKAAEELSTKFKIDDIQKELTAQLKLIDLRGDRQIADTQIANQARFRASEVALGSSSQTAAADANALDIQRELAKSNRAILDFQSGRNQNETLYHDALQRSQELSGRLVDAQYSQVSAIQAEAQARVQANEELLAGSRQRLGLLDEELDKQREIGQTERDRLGDGAVRFAQLSQKDQGEAIRAQQLAQSGRASELTRDQRDLLNRIGTRNAVSAVRRADIADANQSGFSRFFGQGERDIIDRSIKQQTQITSQQAIVQAQIADQTKISVELAQDADKLAAKVMQRVRQTLDARDKRMLAIIAKDREVSRAERTDKSNVAVAQLRGSGAR